MNVKKLAIIGAVALVVIGCVVAAGCTSTSTTTTTTSGTTDSFVGVWIGSGTTSGGQATFFAIINEDGSLTEIHLYDSGETIHEKGTWKKNADGTYTLTGDGSDKYGEKSVIYTLQSNGKTIKSSSGIEFTRVDPIIGIWYNKGTDYINGKPAKFSTVFLPDGTGYNLVTYDDNSTKVIHIKWTRNSDGSYTRTDANSFSDTFTLDKNSEKLTSSKYKELIKEKMFIDIFSDYSMLGPWYDEKNNYLTFFNADGTGTTYKGKEQAENNVIFTWELKEPGKYVLHVKSGTASGGQDISGQDRIWTYDRVNDTFTAQDGTVCIRPKEAVGDFIITRFT